ncbi:MAG: outer membrane lipid asymmetry maintenance protein MlaD [Aestuariivita sp.]|nr:outer membrane lipid asymmetry maintenance protein MlaD [Aestuariivita sp.]
MSNYSKLEIGVGGIVFAIAIGFAVFFGQTTGFNSNSGTYNLTASFRSLEGISIGTDVRLAGVKVGSVVNISLNPETYRVETRFGIREKILIPDDSVAVISLEGVLGGNFVEIIPGGSPEFLADGQEILDTQSPVNLISLLLKFADNVSLSSAK